MNTKELHLETLRQMREGNECLIAAHSEIERLLAENERLKRALSEIAKPYSDGSHHSGAWCAMTARNALLPNASHQGRREAPSGA